MESITFHAFSDTAAKAKPGGVINAFCDPVTTISMPQSSVMIGIARIADKGILEMGEGKPGMGAREAAVDGNGAIEHACGDLIVMNIEPVHVPQAPVIGRPGVKVAGRQGS